MSPPEVIEAIDALARTFPFLALVVGFIALGWSADRFVAASASAARNFGVSKIAIGLTAVAVGTSAPEIMVGIQAALGGTGELAIGNAIGSNICNIGFVLGVAALVRPLPFAPSVLRRELPWLIGATLVALVCLFNLYLGWLDAVALLGGLGLILYQLASSKNGALSEVLQSEVDEFPQMDTWRAVLWFSVGLAVLLLSSHVLVGAASEVARRFNVDELIIGLTVVAVGTSLPELGVTVTAARKGHADMAIGNVVGSNILNILAVLAIPALLDPQAIDVPVLWRDYGTMLALTALLILFAYGVGSRKVITRFEGLVLLAAWIGYTSLLVLPTLRGTS